jgi:hypothetical protein
MYTTVALALIPFGLGVIFLKMAYTKDLKLGIKQTLATRSEKKKLALHGIVLLCFTVGSTLGFLSKTVDDHHDHAHDNKHNNKITERITHDLRKIDNLGQHTPSSSFKS